MLLSEFIERTGVQPSAEEYARIEEEYYDFPGDKDAFCRAWVKSHPASVKKAKERKKRSEENNRVLNVLFRLDSIKATRGGDWWRVPAKSVLREKECELLRRNKLSPDACVNDLMFDIHSFIQHSTERV